MFLPYIHRAAAPLYFPHKGHGGMAVKEMRPTTGKDMLARFNKLGNNHEKRFTDLLSGTRRGGTGARLKCA